VTHPAPGGAKRVGYLELFFDLVFVFAVTQLVSALHDDHTGAGWGRAGVLLWLVWWAWSQFAWAGNAIDLDRRTTRMWVLVAAGAMLASAAVLPRAFDGDRDGLVFGVLYAGVRLMALGLYWYGLREDRAHRAALRTYLPVQVLSPLLVAGGGVAHGDLRTTLWVLAIAVDLVSAAAAGRGEFRVDPSHFAERHGLIVIIALGETVVAIGATASDLGTGGEVGLLLAVAFAAVAGLWWCYFDWVHAAAEAQLADEPDHRRRGHLARDLFTLGHLPIVAGTVVFAAAIEEALLHPTEELGSFGITALAVGPGLYLAGFVAGNLRATGRLLPTRTLGLVAVVAAAFTGGHALPATAAVGAVAAVVIAVAATERAVRARDAPHATTPDR
jgi:low temperature requirement protein LtrA